MHTDNNKTPSTFPKETSELWGKVRKQAEAGEAKKLRDLLEEMELSPSLIRVFIAAVAEEKELAAIVAAGMGQAVRVRECRAKAGHVGGTPTSTIEEGDAIARQRADLMQQAIMAERAAGAGDRANGQLRWLHFSFPELFGKSPPPHAGYLSSTVAAPNTADALKALEVTELYGTVAVWRQAGMIQRTAAEQRRRIFSSFSPVQQDRR